jgi:hypothetical protein
MDRAKLLTKIEKKYAGHSSSFISCVGISLQAAVAADLFIRVVGVKTDAWL